MTEIKIKRPSQPFPQTWDEGAELMACIAAAIADYVPEEVRWRG